MRPRLRPPFPHAAAMSVPPTHWVNVGRGECIDKAKPPGNVYAHGPATAMASSLAGCQAACVKGQSLCAGINWLPDGGGHAGSNCMIQAKRGPSQADIEKAIGTPLASWWTASDPSLPIMGADNHDNGDWTDKATCWALKSGAGDSADDAGLGWSLVLLLLGGLSAYLVLGALHIRLTTKPSQRPERWPLLPHRAFWWSTFGLLKDGAEFVRGGMRRRGGGGGRGADAGGGGDDRGTRRRSSAASGSSPPGRSSSRSKGSGKKTSGKSKSKTSGGGGGSKSGGQQEPLLPAAAGRTRERRRRWRWEVGAHCFIAGDGDGVSSGHTFVCIAVTTLDQQAGCEPYTAV